MTVFVVVVVVVVVALCPHLFFMIVFCINECHGSGALVCTVGFDTSDVRYDRLGFISHLFCIFSSGHAKGSARRSSGSVGYC